MHIAQWVHQCSAAVFAIQSMSPLPHLPNHRGVKLKMIMIAICRRAIRGVVDDDDDDCIRTMIA